MNFSFNFISFFVLTSHFKLSEKLVLFSKDYILGKEKKREKREKKEKNEGKYFHAFDFLIIVFPLRLKATPFFLRL